MSALVVAAIQRWATDVLSASAVQLAARQRVLTHANPVVQAPVRAAWDPPPVPVQSIVKARAMDSVRHQRQHHRTALLQPMANRFPSPNHFSFCHSFPFSFFDQ